MAKWVTTDELKAAIEEFHPLGWSDAEIARKAAHRHGQRVNRHRVGVVRRSLGLQLNTWSQHRRNQVAAKTREQLAAAGVDSLAKIRLRAWDKWKQDLGWPAELTVRAVQALEVFYKAQVPLTRVQLCQLMGVPSQPRTMPKSNAKGGTVLAELTRAGLVVRLRKACPGGRQTNGRGKKIDLYCIQEGVKPNGKRKKQQPSVEAG